MARPLERGRCSHQASDRRMNKWFVDPRRVAGWTPVKLILGDRGLLSMDCLLTRRENLSAVRSPAYVDASGRAVILMRRQIEPRAFSIKPSPPRADTLGDGRIRNRGVSRARSPRTVLDAPADRPPSDRHEPRRLARRPGRVGRNLWPRARPDTRWPPTGSAPIERARRAAPAGRRDERPPARAAQERPPGVGPALRRVGGSLPRAPAPAGRAASRRRRGSLAGARRDDGPQPPISGGPAK